MAGLKSISPCSREEETFFSSWRDLSQGLSTSNSVTKTHQVTRRNVLLLRNAPVPRDPPVMSRLSSWACWKDAFHLLFLFGSPGGTRAEGSFLEPQVTSGRTHYFISPPSLVAAAVSLLPGWISQGKTLLLPMGPPRHQPSSSSLGPLGIDLREGEQPWRNLLAPASSRPHSPLLAPFVHLAGSLSSFFPVLFASKVITPFSPIS